MKGVQLHYDKSKINFLFHVLHGSRAGVGARQPYDVPNFIACSSKNLRIHPL